MTTLAINELWSYIQSLSMTASNERWLAERLLESAKAKSVANEQEVQSHVWDNYQLSPEIIEMTLKNRKMVSNDIEKSLLTAIEEKYK